MSVTITIKDAVKKYGETTVIPGLSLTIKEGELASCSRCSARLAAARQRCCE